jgi:hypothetical protein
LSGGRPAGWRNFGDENRVMVKLDDLTIRTTTAISFGFVPVIVEPGRSGQARHRPAGDPRGRAPAMFECKREGESR